MRCSRSRRWFNTNRWETKHHNFLNCCWKCSRIFNMVRMALKCSIVFLLVKRHGEGMSKALCKHLWAFRILPPVRTKMQHGSAWIWLVSYRSKGLDKIIKTYQAKDLTRSTSETSFSIPFTISSTTTPSLNLTTTKCLISPMAPAPMNTNVLTKT